MRGEHCRLREIKFHGWSPAQTQTGLFMFSLSSLSPNKGLDGSTGNFLLAVTEVSVASSAQRPVLNTRFRKHMDAKF